MEYRFMKTLCQYFVTLLSVCSMSVHGAAEVGGAEEVPKGLAKSDWSSIRAAYEAGRHAFQPVAGKEGVWQARNPGQQWITTFDPRGFTAQPQGGGWTWGLELLSYGFGDQQQAVYGMPAVKADGQRLSYQWDATVQEWFVNDQRGLEHGFIVAQRPGAEGEKWRFGDGGRLSFTMLTPRRPTAKSFRRRAGRHLPGRQRDPRAELHRPEGLGYRWQNPPGALRASGGCMGFRLLVDEADARYPITHRPPWPSRPISKPATPRHMINSGRSVAVSGDTARHRGLPGGQQRHYRQRGRRQQQRQRLRRGLRLCPATQGVWSPAGLSQSQHLRGG